MNRAAVIGAGIMGAGIAAHLANVGIPVAAARHRAARRPESKDRAARNRIAQTGMERALKAKPASAFYTAQRRDWSPSATPRTTWPSSARSTWIVEAVFERLDVKRDLYARHRAGAAPSSHHHLEHVGPPGDDAAGGA